MPIFVAIDERPMILKDDEIRLKKTLTSAAICTEILADKIYEDLLGGIRDNMMCNVILKGVYISKDLCIFDFAYTLANKTIQRPHALRLTYDSYFYAEFPSTGIVPII